MRKVIQLAHGWSAIIKEKETRLTLSSFSLFSRSLNSKSRFQLFYRRWTFWREEYHHRRLIKITSHTYSTSLHVTGETILVTIHSYGREWKEKDSATKEHTVSNDSDETFFYVELNRSKRGGFSLSLIWMNEP